QLLSPRSERHPEGVPQTVVDNQFPGRVGVADPRAVREGEPRVRVRWVVERDEAQGGTGRTHRVTRRPPILGAERATLRDRVSARVPGRLGTRTATELPVIDAVEVRTVAATHVQGLVRAELVIADGMARELLAPIMNQHRLSEDRRTRLIDA